MSSFKTRFAVSVVANVSRAGITFLTGIILAKGLAPEGYGELTFLLGSFTAIRALLDMGTSSAFYTFISQYSRNIRFYLFYFLWMGAQLAITILCVFIVLPQEIVDTIWVRHSQSMILLALIANYSQQYVWTTVVQIGESQKNTIKIQALNFCIVSLHLVIVLVLQLLNILSVQFVFIVLIIEYLVGSIVSYFILRDHYKVKAEIQFNIKDTVVAYYKYCKPLAMLSIVTCCYTFTDRWLLQHFGGAEQQGFYQVSAQVAAISLLATTSITHIFWKEMAEASARDDVERMASLYRNVSRGLLMVGAFFACFMVPWAEQVVRVLLGDAYIKAWPVLAIMFAYPIHQSLGQVNATLFMASGQTRVYTLIGVVGMLVSIPVSCYLLAPPGHAYISGAGLGALGLSIKIVVENMICVNVQAWVIARLNNWKYEWAYQVTGVAFLLTVAFSSKVLICNIIPSASEATEIIQIIPAVLIAGCLYVTSALLIFWKFPAIAGFDRSVVSEIELACRNIFRFKG